MPHLLLFVAHFIAITVIRGELTPSLEIQPNGPEITRPVGSSLALTCKPNVQDPRLVSQLEWRDTRSRRIENTNPESSIYIQKLTGEPGAVLFFSKLKENLAGSYTCSAMYANTEQIIASAKVTTIEDITWVDAPESQYPIAGADYLVKCHVRANPAPVVDWWKNNVQVTSNEHYVIEHNGLLIKNVRESDDGVYTCRAVVVFTGQVQNRNIKVEVHVPPSVEKIETVEIIEGEQASVQCVGSGKPPPSYSWIKENTREDLSITDRFSVNKINGLLIISRVEFHDDSFYRCTASNPAGKVETSVKINVLRKPKIYEFINITAPIKAETKIICKVSGRPLARVTFRKLSNKEPFTVGPQKNDSRIVLEQQSDEYKGETFGILNIYNLNRTDDGLYECIAENKVGTAYLNGHIAVEFPPTFERVKSITPPVWSWENKPGNLTCIAESIPNATIEWRYGGIVIENTTNMMKTGNGPISSLIVNPYSDKRFFTNYECIASNKLGRDSMYIELRQATVPGFVQQAKIHTITATTVKFNIVGPPSFLTLPTRSFMVQYQTERQRLWETSRNHTWSANASYILENLIPEETYNFRFAAKNDVGLGGWAANQQITMPRRSAPAEPKILKPNDNPNVDSNEVQPDIVTNSPYADRYELRWNVPGDNGEPIDSYHIRYCVSQKVNGDWKDSEDECSGTLIQSFEYLNYELNNLRPDTTYKVELRAHNAIGLSSPAQIRVKTARGKDMMILVSEETSLTSAAIIGIVIATVLVILILVDVVCCCVNRAGILALICEFARSKPVDEEDPKLGSDEKEPLRAEERNHPQIVNGDKRNISVEFDGKQVYSKTGEIIGKHSAV